MEKFARNYLGSTSKKRRSSAALDVFVNLQSSMIAFKSKVFFNGVEEAVDFCHRLADAFGRRHVGAMAEFCDPIFWGAVLKNPWQFLEDRKLSDRDLAFLYACGWNRATAPQHVQQHAEGAKRFGGILRAKADVLRPWVSPVARRLVSECYFNWCIPHIDYGDLGSCDVTQVEWFATYVQFMTNYQLVSKQEG